MGACHKRSGRRLQRCTCRHGRMMEAFDTLTQLWWDKAEAATSLYPTELAEYRASHPVPTLGPLMKESF